LGYRVGLRLARCVAAVATVSALLWSAAGGYAPVKHPLTPTSGAPGPRFYDVRRIQQAPLEVEIAATRRLRVRGRWVCQTELSFPSGRWQGRPVHIAAYLAVPESSDPLPGLLLDSGDIWRATRWALESNVACLALDRPGTGLSSGPADVFSLWYDCVPDPRESWMYHSVVAALRGLTVLQRQEGVDGRRLAIAGSSRGGTMALLVNGLDNRVKLALPTATGGFILDAVRRGGQARVILRDLFGVTSVTPEFAEFARWFDPANYLATQHGTVCLCVAAQDEYFPLPQTRRTYAAIRADKRLCLLPNWAHHGPLPSADPAARLYGSALRRAAIRSLLHGQNDLPAGPTLRLRDTAQGLRFEAQVDRVTEASAVRIWLSRDGGFSYQSAPLHRRDGSVFSGGWPDPACALADIFACWAEVRYAQGLALSSQPQRGTDPSCVIH